ncbi:TRAF-type zinc finger domain-containing protein 1 isoform X2 [Ciconia boyciana]|uniref:TRAF-type zinc finger domain-containing protein 1 isoform X2 n=1 Tax=Ciconia boyciana TaxID=52775 RepID=UPI003B9F290E
MAIAAVTEAETRLCGNCKKDIPVANFTMHEIHCSRNIEVCRYCSELIPKSEMKNHIESEHGQVTCKCRMKIEKCHLKDHEASACPLRPAVCQYCDIQLTFNKLQDHEIYCGARTERCGGCGRNVMVKDLKDHPRVCGQDVKQVRGSRTVPRFQDEDADLHALRDIRNRLRSDDEIIMLPCEFCEELYPAEDLILHQTGCNPASAFASFSKRSSSPNPREDDGLRAIGSKSCRSLSSSQPHAVQAEGNMIPCEFCGIQLEEEILFHHQHHCDLRPASPAASFPSQQLLAPQANGERRESPELARRRIRHQGDVSPRCTEGFGQQRLSYPARGTKSLNNMANTRNAPLSSSARGSDAPNSRGRPSKVAGSEGRPKNRGTSESAGGTMPRARPTQNFHSEAFTSSFSRTSPAQPSTSDGGGRSLGMSSGPVGFRRRNTKAKAQSPASGHPEK